METTYEVYVTTIWLGSRRQEDLIQTVENKKKSTYESSVLEYTYTIMMYSAGGKRNYPNILIL